MTSDEKILKMHTDILDLQDEVEYATCECAMSESSFHSCPIHGVDGVANKLEDLLDLKEVLEG